VVSYFSKISTCVYGPVDILCSVDDSLVCMILESGEHVVVSQSIACEQQQTFNVTHRDFSESQKKFRHINEPQCFPYNS